MEHWKEPPVAKVFEALSAVADNRVRLGEHFAEVGSSDGAKTYQVVWKIDRTAYGSNDNASYWVGYIGYPIIATLIASGLVTRNQELIALLGGVNWNALNKKFSRNYSAAVDEVLGRISEQGGDAQAVRAYADQVHAEVLKLDIGRLKPSGSPPARKS